MGLIGNGSTQELESNMIDNNKMDCKRSDTETAAQREATGAQMSIEKKTKETGPNHEEISEDVGAEKGEPGLVNVEIMASLENLEVASQNGLTSLENVSTLPGGSVTNDSGHLNNEDKGSSGQSGKRKAKPKGPVASSWSLRSKSGEKPPKAPEPNDTVKEGTLTGEKKRRRRKKKQQQQQNTTVSEFAKTKTHLRYLLHRIKFEQNLIDAYSAEGWKGQSLEKLKPEKELERAKSHILRYKMRIRELFQRLELSFAVGKIPESLFDSLGEIDCEDIFCSKCGSKDLTLDNDIILCDGACERGFHQFCLEPPLLKEHIPPGDEGWLCPGCDCKVDCIDMLKDFQGTKVSITDSWEKIFPEAAAEASGKLDGGSGSLSDDSEDDDYDPDKHNNDDKVKGGQSSSNESDYFSAPDESAAPPNNTDKFLGLPSDDSEDDDFDPSAPDQDEDEQVNQDGSSSDFTSDSEDLDALLEDEGGHGEDVSQTPPSLGLKEENSTVGRRKGQLLKDELSFLMEASAEPVSGKRHVERMDYKKLHDETFGNSSSDSSDEDFDDTTSCDGSSSQDDTTSRKRRKIDRAKTQAKRPGSRTPIVKSSMNTNDENQKENKQLPRRTPRKGAGGGPSVSSAKVGSPASSGAKKLKRLGEATTQKLYASFSANQYPDKAAKENLAKELDITIRQVSKWFENARWSFNHRSRMESNSTEKLPEPQPIPAEAEDGNLVQNAGTKLL